MPPSPRLSLPTTAFLLMAPSSPPSPSSSGSAAEDATGALLRSDGVMEDDDNLDAKLQLAELRRKLTGANVEPVHFRHWQVERRLGRGGMGAVYLAYDPNLERRVALKVLNTTPGSGRRSMAERLRREALALAQIEHQHVVKVHRVDLEHDRPVIEMEYVDGLTLRQWAKLKRTWREIVGVYLDAARGLAAIHEAKLVHRDIKPDNLLIGSDGCVKVADLGLAVGPRNPPTSEGPGPTGSGLLGARLTRDSTVVGTLGYMAPELYGLCDVTAACDQFGFAASLFEALFGTLPFTGQTPAEYARAMRRGPARPPPRAPAVPRWLTRAIHRGLRFDAAQRHPSMAAMVDTLDQGLGRRRRWWIGVSALGTAITLGGIAGRLGWDLGQAPTDPCETLAREIASEGFEPWLEPIDAALGPDAPDHLVRSSQTLAQAVKQHDRDWTLSRLSLCEAQDTAEPVISTELLAQRRRCLEDTRARLHRHLEGVAGSQDLAWSLVETTTAVERLPRCEDEAELRRWALPTDDGTTERLEALLAEAHALEQAGDYSSAEQRARSVVDASNHESLRWLHADALYRLGHILGVQDRQSEAFDVLDRARNVALSVGYNALLCDAIVHQSKLASSIALDTESSRRDLGLATACIKAERTQSPLVQSDLLEARGLLAQANGDPAQAVKHHRESLELRRTYLGPNHHELSRTLVNLANALAESGELDAALEEITRGLEIRTASLGEDHPRVADLRFDRAEILRALGRLDDARDDLEQALRIYDHAGSPRWSARANVHLALAAIDLDDAQLDSASEHLRQARELQDADPDLADSDPDRAYLLHAEGSLYIRQEDFASAFEAVARATELLRRHEPDHPDVQDSTLREIEMLYGLGEHRWIAYRAGREGPWLAQYLEQQPSEDQGRYGWYVGDSCLRQQRGCAARYLRLALEHYRRQGNEASNEASDEASNEEVVPELSWMLAQALQDSSEHRVEAIELARVALDSSTGPKGAARKRRITRWIIDHPPPPTNQPPGEAPMTYPVGNETTVDLTYTVGSQNDIDLIYDDDPLDPYHNSIFVELQDPDPNDSIEPTTTITIKDASNADVHVWENTPNGLIPWSRNSAGTGSYAIHSDVDTELLVVHVPSGVSVPSPTSTDGPPAPGTSQRVLKVKVKKQGDQPI